MADDMNNTPETPESEGLPEDLRRLLARAESDDEGTDVYVEDEGDEEEEDEGEPAARTPARPTSTAGRSSSPSLAPR